MFTAAKEEDLTLIINSSYRSYEEQEEIYNDFKNTYGEKYADARAAKPGFSEHQTGMSIDIQTYGSSASTFEEFDEFKWLQKNAHKYGFILRYPKDKDPENVHLNFYEKNLTVNTGALVSNNGSMDFYMASCSRVLRML